MPTFEEVLWILCENIPLVSYKVIILVCFMHNIRITYFIHSRCFIFNTNCIVLIIIFMPNHYNLHIIQYAIQVYADCMEHKYTNLKVQKNSYKVLFFLQQRSHGPKLNIQIQYSSILHSDQEIVFFNIKVPITYFYCGRSP